MHMRMNELLEKRNTIYGASAIWIMLYHMYKYLSTPDIPILSNFLEIGLWGVDIFLFISGVCLSRSAKKHKYSGKTWLVFFQKRASRLLLPYAIVAIPFYCWMAVCSYSGGIVHRTLLFFADFTFITYLMSAKTAFWFVFGIALYYLLFPFLFHFAQNKSLTKNCLLILTMIIFSALCTFIPVLHNIRIVFARLPIFAIGVLFGINEEEKTGPGAIGILLSGLTILALGWAVSEVMLPARDSTMNLISWYLFIPMTLLLLMIVSAIGKNSVFLGWLGGFSLEIYLVHIVMLRIFSFYGIIDLLGNVLYLVLPICSIPVAYLVRLLSNYILHGMDAREFAVVNEAK